MDVVVLAISIPIGLVVVGFILLVEILNVSMLGYCGELCAPATVAWWIGLLGPGLLFLAAIGWSIARIAMSQRAWWVPLVGLAAGIGVVCLTNSALSVLAGRSPLDWLG